MTYERLEAAAGVIAAATGRPRHDAAVVLGSGLSDYGAGLEGAIEVPYAEIPCFPVPAVSGHAGSVFSAEVATGTVLVLAGRVHTYEGWPLDEVVFAVRAAALSGAHTALLTNAAGGVGEGLMPGDLVALRDHLNLAGRNPLFGTNEDRLGPRFPDMSEVYSAEVRGLMADAAADIGMPYKEGVYAWLLGPSYETPAEIEMLRRLGADLVGMSTVPEAIALRHMGARVGAISLVTNLAAGMTAAPLSHAEVTETAALAKERFTGLLDALLPQLARLDA